MEDWRSGLSTLAAGHERGSDSGNERREAA